MYAALSLIGILFLFAPLLEGGFGLLFFEVSSLIEVLDPSVRSSTGALTVWGLLIEGLAFSAVLLFGAMLVGLLAVGTILLVLRVFIKPDSVYLLYVYHYSMLRRIHWLSSFEY